MVFCSFVFVRECFSDFNYLFEFKFYLSGVLVAICVVGLWEV
jgi:hypothetical protein